MNHCISNATSESVQAFKVRQGIVKILRTKLSRNKKNEQRNEIIKAMRVK